MLPHTQTEYFTLDLIKSVKHFKQNLDKYYQRILHMIKTNLPKYKISFPKSKASDIEADISLLCLREHTYRLYNNVM